MNKKINYGMIFSVVLAVMLLVGAGLYVNDTSGLKNDIQNRDEVITDKDNALLVKDTEISNLVNEVTSLSQNVVEAVDLVTDNVIDTVVDVVESVGYLIDELSIDSSIEDEFDNPLTDRELNLFDGKVEFIDEDGDDEDYNMDEYLTLSDIVLTVNEEDYNENVYAVVSEDAIEYKVVFEGDLNTSLIDEDNTLVFNFLGEQIEIVEWDETEVTFKKATEVMVDEGESIVVDGVTVLLDMVMDDSVYVTVNGDSEKINEGDTKKVGGIEVYASEVLYTEKNSRVSKAILAIGTDVEETVEDSDEYEDSIYNFIIDESSIGLTLAENFNSDLDDEDEDDYKPLGYGDKICLPNDYVCVEFVGLSDEEYSEYELDYDSDGELTITGDFEDGTDDVDELIIDSDGMYYEDEDDNKGLHYVDNVTLKDSELVLSYGNASKIVTIDGDIEMPMNLSNIDFGNVETEEGTYRSIYGSIIELKDDLEDEDNELSILVPEERVELSFLVY